MMPMTMMPRADTLDGRIVRRDRARARLARCAAAAAVMAGSCGAASPPTTLRIAAAGTVPGTIKDSPVHMIMAADGLSYPVLNPAIAERLALGGSFFGVQAKIGSVAIPGHTGVVRVGVGGTMEKRRALWFDKPVADTADGMLGPESVPYSVVTFVLRPASAGERRYALPMTSRGGRLGTTVQAGPSAIFVQWNTQRATTIGTAAAASDLSLADDGRFDGAARGEIIRFGVKRPVRSLALARPFVVGPVRVTTLDARVSDYGSAAAIPSGDGDPGEIVVVGRKGKDKSEHVVTIGRADIAASCSSISFDKPAKQIVLTCS